MTKGLLVVFLLGSGIGYSAEDDVRANFHVAADGNDAGSGTIRKPFASLARARDAVRELKKGGLKKNVTVLVKGGTYWLKEPLVFGPEDSGTEKFSITYAAAPGEKPVFSGGRKITGWKKGEGNLWTVELPGVKAGEPALRGPGASGSGSQRGWFFRQLFVNGRRAVRARSPNNGFFRVVAAGPDNRTSFAFKKGDLLALKNPEDAEIVFLHDWSVSRVRLKAVDEATDTVSFSDPIGGHHYDFGKISFWPHARYHIENAPELLDTSGEWHLDRRTGILSYWPLPGEDMTRAEVIAPRLESLLELKGEATRPVVGLIFKGLSFAHSEWPLPEHGIFEVQAGFHQSGSEKKHIRPGAAVSLVATTRCAVEDCCVEHAGAAGISLAGPAQDNRVVGCEVRDIGFSGIMVGSTENKAAELARNNRVANNRVHHCAQVAHGCVGVWVGLTEGTVVANNEIHDLPYTGISVGWSWNTEPTQCQKNVVEFNHIHDVMQMLSDGGGIYTLGRQPGTILRGNLIHDIPPNAGGAESNGMFLDEGSSAFTVEGNTIHGVARSAIRFHKATGLTIRRNTLLVSAGRGPFMFNSCEEKNMTFEENTVTAAPRASPRAAGKSGRALACNGINTWEEVAHSPDLEPAELTLEAWVKPFEHPAGEDARRWIVNKNGNEWQEGHYALCVSDGKAGAYVNIGGGRENGFSAWSTNAPLTIGQWHHLAATYDGKDLRLYVDGAPAGGVAVNKVRVRGTSPLAIGRRQDGLASSYFKGLIDEVRIYRKALTAADLVKAARDPKAIAVPESLAGLWGFDDEPGSHPEAAADKAGLEPAYRARSPGK